MRKLRYTALALFCAGLLLTGIGAGVAFAEFSGLTYGGEQLMTGAKSQTQHMTITLQEPENTLHLRPENIFHYSDSVSVTATPVIVEKEEMAPGTISLDITYEAIPGISLMADTVYYPDLQKEELVFHWYSQNEVALFFAAKDQIFDDLKDSKVSTYIPLTITELTITANPANQVVWDTVVH